MEVYISDISGNYNQIDVTDAELVRNRDFSSGDTFEFWASSKVAIPQRAFVKVTESGGTRFRGAVMYSSGKLDGRPLAWTCWSLPQLLKTRSPFPMRYGAPVIEEDYVALTVGDVISSDPPSQSAGVAQYYPGLAWMAQSYLSVSPDSIDADGVRCYEGWGTNSRAGTKNVYVGGHLCTERALVDLADNDYSFYRNSDDLYIFGVGVGDLGPYCIDNVFDYGLRIGNMDHAGDYHLAPLDIGMGGDSTAENYWQIIEDYLFSLGIYLRLRHSGDYTYLDGSINPWVRGSSAGGAFSLSPDDWISLEQSTPNQMTPSALVGVGAGAGITQIQYTRCSPSDRGAWIELEEEVTEGLLSPMGYLDLKIDALWDELANDDFFKLKTPLGHLRVGDWVDLQVSESRIATAQIYEIAQGIGPVREIALGGKYAAPKYAFLERQESASVAAHRAGQMVGSKVASDFIGPSDTLEIAWTPAASSADRDTERITLSLWATTPSDSNESAYSPTFTVSITNTLYPGGQVIATLRNMPWASDPVFEDLDISDWCAIDGTEETITISVSDPWGELSETLGYTAQINGIGRYGQTPKAILTRSSAVSSTMDQDFSYIRLDIPATAGSKSGTGLYYYTDEAVPYYSFKVVLRSGAEIAGPTSGISAKVRPFIKTGGKTFYGVTRNLTGAYVIFEDAWQTNPDTLAVWKQSEINDIQAGMILSATYGANPYVGTYRGLWAQQIIELR